MQLRKAILGEPPQPGRFAMRCPQCQGSTRRFGRNRNGSHRYRCDACPRTFTDAATCPPDRREVPADRTIMCLRMLLEGTSVRTVERLTGTHRDTILSAMVDAGERCAHFLGRAMEGYQANDVQADEIWGFVACKEKTRQRNGYGDDVGDCWCYTAIERTSKVIIAYHVGRRTPAETGEFARKLYRATNGRFQLTTDGLNQYRIAIPGAFGQSIDYAQLVKVYSNPPRGPESRYSPGEIVECHPVVITGAPDESRICTSHAERSNLSIRMAMRRMTRLTNAHSKKFENHRAAFGLWFAFYNYCRPHATLTEEFDRKTTPAMAGGLADHVWNVAELLQRA